MDMTLLSQILGVLIQAVEAGIKFAPDIIADFKLLVTLLTSGTELTDDQKAQAKSAVDKAHAELQAQIAADAEEDAGGTEESTEAAT